MKSPLFSSANRLAAPDWWRLLPLLALFISFGSATTAWAGAGVSSSTLAVRATTTTGTTNITYNGTRSSATASNPAFDPTSTNPPGSPVRNLGLFNLDTGELRFTAATLGILTFEGAQANQGRLFYRAYLSGSTSLPAYSSIQLAELTRTGDADFGRANFSTSAGTTSGNILTGLLSGGLYKLEVYFRADGTGDGFPVISQNSQNTPPTPFVAEFRVVPPAVTPANALTSWNGNVSNQWTNPANWSNGVPNEFADAFIPRESDANGNNQVRRFPILNNINQRYAVRNLTVDAVDFANRGLIRVTNAVLRIYGDLENGANGILATADQIPTEGGTTFQSATISFEGGNQRLDQGRFANVIIAGTGVKSLTGILELPGGTIRFIPAVAADGVILRTTRFTSTGPVVSTSGPEFVDLGELGRISNVLGEKETNTSFILGLTKASNIPQVGVPQDFGNIGLTITIGNSGAGRFAVTRSVGPFFLGRGSFSTARSTKRQFGVSVGNSNVDIDATLLFAYNDSDATTGGESINELNGNSEPDLQIFRTTESGAVFDNLGGVASVGSNTVTTTGVQSINTITLASRSNPLPVSLVSFVAQRSGNVVNLNWVTVSELNNSGFTVQVSADGNTFRNLGVVASNVKDGNTTTRQEYRFADTESGKQGIRYYRLLQTDNDGKQSYSGIQVVNFSAQLEQTALTAFPNPFDAELWVNMQLQTAGDTRVVLLDMTGRVMSQQLLTLPRGTSTFTLDGVQSLKPGFYFVKVIMADGTESMVKVMKR